MLNCIGCAHTAIHPCTCRPKPSSPVSLIHIYIHTQYVSETTSEIVHASIRDICDVHFSAETDKVGMRVRVRVRVGVRVRVSGRARVRAGGRGREGGRESF